jgi:1-acyl-sn-glycerol-3-phosphate acyltransferase
MNISKWILEKLHWKIHFEIEEIPNKCVICIAPHTSNWDFVIGKLVYWSLGRKASFLIKKGWTIFPLSLIFKPMGAIPVNQRKHTSITEQVVEKFKHSDNLQVAITPEGTRKRNPVWKKGFYYMALGANVPILLVSLDYKKKLVNFGKIVIPTGDVDKDMIEIESFFKGVSGKIPENFATEI